LTEARSARLAAKRLLELLGLAARAGRLVAGTDAVRQAVRDGEVAWVLLAADASPTQQAKLLPLLEARTTPYHRLLARAEVGAAVGRAPLSAVGLTDANFARRAIALVGEFPAVQD
jgi:ribosomal protein L7Ae-like RNA K-turn-binding protein